MTRKSLLVLLVILPGMLLIMGCPVSTDHPAGIPGTEEIDQKLVGTWKNKTSGADGEALLVNIARNDKYSYDVTILEKGSMYAASDTLLEGFITRLDGKSFFYVRPVGKSDEYYLYNYQVDGKTIRTYDVSLRVGGIDAVTSTEEFRKEISASLKFEDCLNGEIVWVKE